jgi:integrase
MALRDHRVAQAGERLRAGSAWQDTGPAFTTPIGSRVYDDLRHTCASLLLAQGVEARVIMETLGHSQIATTMNTYAHVLPVLQRQAADRMDRLLTRDSC